jgi:hypothetical protein
LYFCGFFSFLTRRNSIPVGDETSLHKQRSFYLKNIRFFAEIVVSFGQGKSTQTDCDDDDDDDDDDDNDDDDDDLDDDDYDDGDDDEDENDTFFDEIFGIGVLSLFFCGFFWTGVNGLRYIG